MVLRDISKTSKCPGPCIQIAFWLEIAWTETLTACSILRSLHVTILTIYQNHSNSFNHVISNQMTPTGNQEGKQPAARLYSLCFVSLYVMVLPLTAAFWDSDAWSSSCTSHSGPNWLKFSMVELVELGPLQQIRLSFGSPEGWNRKEIIRCGKSRHFYEAYGRHRNAKARFVLSTSRIFLQGSLDYTMLYHALPLRATSFSEHAQLYA